ncbi:MAG: copper chaperone PCu(A)C [Sphingomicrobium sp.]
MSKASCLTTVAVVLLAACRPAVPTAPSIELRDAWARETAPGQTSGAAYLTIVNTGREDDRLIGVTAPKATGAMLHSASERGGVASMRMASEVAIPAETTVTLAPLGTHIMLTGLAAPLKPGERVALTLRFARAGPRLIEAAVLPAGSNGPAD